MSLSNLLSHHSLIALFVAGAALSAQAVPTAPMAEIGVNYRCGDIKADPSRNVVYIVDQTDNKILALDTTLGMVVNSVGIADGATTGKLAISVDDSTLYLAESAEDKILVFSLPNLTAQTSITISFSPQFIVSGAGGRLYASQFSNSKGVISEISTTNGNVLQTFGATENYLNAPLMRTNADGTNLYASELSISGLSAVDKYSISGATASAATPYAFQQDNLQDFAPDETNNRIYAMNGGIYGVNVINTTNDDYSTVWPFTEPYGDFVSYTAAGSTVFGGGGGGNPGEVKIFSRTDGTPLEDNLVGVGSNNGLAGLAATPNGKAVYIRQDDFSGNANIGIIGLSHISANIITPESYLQNGTSLGGLAYNSTFLPSAWQGVGAMGSGWHERAVADINGDGIPDIIFQNGTLIGAVTMNASGAPASWIGIGGMNTGWQLRGAGNISGTGRLDLIFQNGTSIGYLEVSTLGSPMSWHGIGAMGANWQLRAVADLDGDGEPELLFQNGTLLGALKVGTNGLPTAWIGIGSMNTGWILSDAVDVNADGQPDLVFQNGTLLGSIELDKTLTPTAWHGIGGLNAGWTLPGDY